MEDNKPNYLGIYGFVVSFIGLFIFFRPISLMFWYYMGANEGFLDASSVVFYFIIKWFGWLIWFTGLFLSIFGVNREPKGFAKAGIYTSIFGFIALVPSFSMVTGQ